MRGQLAGLRPAAVALRYEGRKVGEPHLPTTQREAFLRAIGRWAVQTRSDGGPLLLYILGALGHPEGNRPMDIMTARHPSEVVSLDGVRDRLGALIDEVGLSEDFLVTGLIRAVEEHLRSMAEGREQAVATFRELRARMDAVAGDAEALVAFKAEHGLGDPDLSAMREQVEQEITRLEDPAWADAQRALLEVWRSATRGLLRPDRRTAWEAQRFEVAAQKLDLFFKGPPDAVMQPLPPGYSLDRGAAEDGDESRPPSG